MTATMTAPADERSDWLAWRRHGVGASDVAAILGISPFASPWSVWAEKVGLIGEQEANEAMEAGHWLELAVGPWFAHKTGLYVTGEQMRCEAATNSVHRCTLDGYVGEGAEVSIDAALGGLEIKFEAFGRRWDEIPAHYQAQGQWQMHVTDLERVWFAVLRGRTLDIHELVRDQDDIDFMVDAVDRFWADHVVAGTPPATDGHDATLRAIAEVYPEATPDAVEIDDIAEVVAQLEEAKAAKKAAEADEAAAKAALQARLGTHEEGTVAGQRVVSWRPQSRSGIDTKALTAAHPDIAEQFATTSEFRVLRTHKPKGAPK